MLATRFINASTGDNLTALMRLISDQNCSEVRLFASPTSSDKGATEADGPESNMPLVAALARYEIPGIAPVYVVFDGLFLTAARRPRFLEVVELMDAAQNGGRVTFATERAPFTAALAPELATAALLKIGSVVPFTAATRAQYFALLSNSQEANYP